MRRSTARTSFTATLLLALCALMLCPMRTAQAQGFTIQNGQTVNQQQNLAAGETGIVEQGGTIDNSGAVGGIDGINGANNVIVDNAGTVIGVDDAIQVGANSQVNNSGLLLGNFGIFAPGGNTTVDNSGTINSTFVGILAGDGNTITNSGSISTTAIDGDGINVNDNNTILNSGSIATIADDAFGILVDDDNAITNTGTIRTGGDDANAIDGDNRNTLTNTGTIITTGDRSDGLNANNNNIVVNRGNVTVSGVDSDAVDVDNNTTVINSGLLRSINDNAIEFDGIGNELVLLPGSVMIGGLEVDFPQNTLTVSPGLSLIYTFNGFAPGAINTFGAPVAVNGLQVAVVDTTALGQSDEMLADVTSGIFNSVHARLSVGVGGSGGSSAFGLGGNSLMGLGARMNLLSDGGLPPSQHQQRSSGAWAQAFAGQRDEEATATSAQAGHNYVGGIAGLDGWLTRSIQIGGFAGGAHSEIEVPLSQDVDVDTFFGGAYANVTDGTNFVRLFLTAGTSDYDSRRRVLNNLVASGFQLATASFDGDFISSEIAAGTAWTLGWLTIEPSARLRYARLSMDGYTETGSAAPFAVGDHDVSLWHGRGQVAFPFTSAAGAFAPRIGLEAWSSDHDNVSGVLLGQVVSFTPGGDDDDVTGFVGATATTKFGSATAFVDGEIHVGDDGYTRSEAHAGIRIPF